MVSKSLALMFSFFQGYEPSDYGYLPQRKETIVKNFGINLLNLVPLQ